MAAITEQEAQRLLAAIVIPPRPTVVTALMEEGAREDPDLKRVAALIAADVALAAAVLKTVNSPLYGLKRRIGDIDQALSLLGMDNLATLVAGLTLRAGLPVRGLDRFWDSAARTALVSAFVAKQLGNLTPTEAHLYGLFRDCGIPLMLQRFSDYKDTLRMANAEANRAFTDVEDERHSTNHAVVGSLLAANWNLPEDFRVAICTHHDLGVYASAISPKAMNLVAVGVLAEHIENDYSRLSVGHEWAKLGKGTLDHLLLDAQALDELSADARTALEESGL